MFVGSVDLGSETSLELVIVPLKGSALHGQWEASTDLLMVCVMQSGRCCTCRPTEDPSRFKEKLDLAPDDAQRLAEWLKNKLSE
jgi:hypothetical protein